MIEPSNEQIEVVEHFIKRTADAPANHHSQVVAEMDDSGALYVYLTEDELTMTALFDRSGKMYGDWLV